MRGKDILKVSATHTKQKHCPSVHVKILYLNPPMHGTMDASLPKFLKGVV